MTDDPSPTPDPSPRLSEDEMRNLLNVIKTVQRRRRHDLQQAAAAVHALQQSGMSLRQIAERTEVPWQTIRNWADTPKP